MRLRPVPVQSRRQHVVEILREAILSGDLAPGHKLKEAELSEQLGASRAPVREALRQLEHEGLIASIPYRGTTVLGVTQEEIEQVLVPIRITLERFAFQKAVPNLTEELIAELQNLVNEMRTAAQNRDFDRLAETDVRFHERVIEASGLHHCLQMWRTIQPRVRSYFRRDASTYTDPHQITQVADQHQQLLDTLVNGTLKQLDTTIEQHIQTYASVLDDAPAKQASRKRSSTPR